MTTDEMDTPRFVFRKADLPSRTPGRVVLARDANETGAKMFAAFSSVEVAAAYAELHRGDSLYEVIEGLGAVGIYIDFDRKGEEHTAVETLKYLLLALADFLRTEFGVLWTPVIGQNCQVLDGTRTGKTSLHVMVRDLYAADVGSLKVIVNGFRQYIADKPAQYSGTLVCEDGSCAVDEAVYTLFRSWRLAHMKKAKAGCTPLTPFGATSDAIIHTMVNTFDFESGTLLEPSRDVATRQRAPRRHVDGRASPGNESGTASMSCADATSLVNKSMPNFVKECVPSTGSLTVIGVARHHTSNTRLKFRMAPGTLCAYAGRAHASNTIYIGYDPELGEGRLLCYDEECAKKIARGGYKLSNVSMRASELIREHDSVFGGIGMHAQANTIQWSEDYDLPYMKELPVAPIVCACAGMGLGKTEAMTSLVERELGGDGLAKLKVLIVTFSRALAVKLYEDFKHLGVVNYQDSKEEIIDERVIVCLDSLPRVKTRLFDFIIIDEACSVFLHYNSPYIKNTSLNSMLLELLVQTCKRGVYFLDAMLDTTFMTLVIKYFADAKGVAPVWIRNRHKRETNRTATLQVTRSGGANTISETSTAFSVAERVLSQLNLGRRVVCCSSTKSFTEVLDTYIKKKRPQTAICMYNSDSASSKLCDIDAEWCVCDLLIYSPSISAGVSFVPLHFDVLVAFLVNSVYTPSVDIAMQQLFRVRQLREGNMFLYVHDSVANKALTDTAEGVHAILDEDLAFSNHVVNTQLAFDAQMRLSRGGIVYDRDRLSFHIIAGIVLTANRSATSYVTLLAQTLIDDYGIPVELTAPPPAQGGSEADVALMCEAAKPPPNVPFTDVLFLNAGQVQTLMQADGGISKASERDRVSVLLYEAMWYRWGVKEEVVDEAFYTKYVIAPKAQELFWMSQRFRTVCLRTATENRAVYAQKLEDVLALDDYNLDLYKSRARKYYDILLIAQEALDAVFGIAGMDALRSGGSLESEESVVSKDVDTHFDSMSAKQLLRLQKLFGLNRRQASAASGYKALQKILKDALNVTLDRCSGNSKRPRYNVLSLNANKHRDFESKYSPTYP